MHHIRVVTVCPFKVKPYIISEHYRDKVEADYRIAKVKNNPEIEFQLFITDGGHQKGRQSEYVLTTEN